MPIDYSKFDNIDDSDDEGAKQPTRAVPAASAGYPGGGGSAPSRATAASRPGRGGGSTLEPAGLEQSLKFLGPSTGDPKLDQLASELEKWAGTKDAAEAAEASRQEAPRKPGEPQRLCMKSDGRKKIHTTFRDGAEMVEEFDERTDVLLVRKVKKASIVGSKEPQWVYEVGQPPEVAFDPSSDLMRASATNPIFLRKDTPEHFQWRIRNLPYPADVYSVTVDHDKQEIVVRTSNKKYYKRIEVPDLRRVGLKMHDNSLSWKHQHNTLIISYLRPREVVEQEQKALLEAEKSAVKL